MTYCVAMRLKEGLVFVSDTRTNAGVDHIATFRKMHIFERRGERSLVLLTAGNLATAQSVISYLCERTQHEVTLTADFAGRVHEWKGTIVRAEGEIDRRTRQLTLIARVAGKVLRWSRSNWTASTVISKAITRTTGHRMK